MILVLTSCTSRKALKAAESNRALPAAQMYQGPQHLATLRGLALLRGILGPSAVALRILSAGYGLLGEGDEIAPYDTTFAGMKKSAIRDRARILGIPGAVRAAARGTRLVVVLLGANYLTAIEPPLAAASDQRFVFLAGPNESGRLAGPGIVVVPAGENARARHRTTFGELKGVMFERFARGVSRGGADLIERVCQDPTPATFERIVALGLEER